MKIVRVLLALLLSLIYAAFAGVCTFVWWQLTHDPRYPGPMIPDNNSWGYLIAIFVTLFAAALGAFVALCATLTESRMLYSALFGAGVGSVVFLMYLADMLRMADSSYHTRGERLLALGVFFLIFPVGLTVVGTVAGSIGNLVKR